MPTIYKTQSGWRAQVRLANKPASSKILPSKREAIIWAREEEERLHKSSSNNPNQTFAEVLEIYQTHARPGGKTKQWTLARLAQYWGDWRMTEIHSGTIATYAARRKREGAGPSTILQDLIYLNVVLGHGGVLAGNREAQVARLELSAAIKSLRHTGTIASSEERDRRPTEAELIALEQHWAARPRLATPMFDIVLFAICTCLRLGEIVGSGGITWEDVNITNRSIWVRGRKDPRNPQGRDELIPLLNGPVTYKSYTVDPCAILARQKSSVLGKGRVFPFSESCVGNGFAQATEACQIDDLHFHDLRHEGISRLFESGLDIPQVASVSGHRSWKNLKRYTHLRHEVIFKL